MLVGDFAKNEVYKNKKLGRENSENFQVAFEFNLNATITVIGESETKTRTALPQGKFRSRGIFLELKLTLNKNSTIQNPGTTKVTRVPLLKLLSEIKWLQIESMHD